MYRVVDREHRNLAGVLMNYSNDDRPTLAICAWCARIEALVVAIFFGNGRTPLTMTTIRHP